MNELQAIIAAIQNYDNKINEKIMIHNAQIDTLNLQVSSMQEKIKEAAKILLEIENF